MAELTKEQLIELITREVLKTLGGGEPEEPADKSGDRKSTRLNSSHMA